MKQAKKMQRFLSTGIAGLMLLQSMALPAFAAEGEPAAETPQYPYLDTSLSFEERALDLVSRMTLEEKISQLKGGPVPGIDRLGVLPTRWYREALHGVARLGPATSFPTGLGIASSWNRELVSQMSHDIGDEARTIPNDVDGEGLNFWSPTINLARDPRWGRAEETYGEDPYLTTEIAKCFVSGLQGTDDPLNEGNTYLKAMSTIKHFVANNRENDRETGSSNTDDRTLREYYAKTFKDVVESTNVQSVMTTYNQYNEMPTSLNSYLVDELLRRTWGFDGHVVTDCGALECVYEKQHWRPEDWEGEFGAKETAAMAFKTGIDLNCGDVYVNYAKAALDAGLITEDDIDIAATRVFTARMRTGEFDLDAEGNHWGQTPWGDYSRNADHSSSDWQLCDENHSAEECTLDHTHLAENAADEAVVLLKNEAVQSDDEPILPLNPTENDNIVVIGDLADEIVLGDYSTGDPRHTSTPLQGVTKYLQAQNPSAQVTYIPGVQSTGGQYLSNFKGFILYYSDGSTAVISADEVDYLENCELESGGNIGYVERSGATIGFNDINTSGLQSIGLLLSNGSSNIVPTQIEVRRESAGGPLLATIDAPVTSGWGDYQEAKEDCAQLGDYGQQPLYFVFKANVDSGLSEEEQDTVRNADTVIAFVGTKQSDASEGKDRDNLDLPRNEADMVKEVAALNPRTIVYIQAVGQINVEEFKDEVPAIFWCTYNGQAQGNAAGRLLFGEANPSAKLTFSWYSDVDQLPDMGDYNIRSSDNNAGRTYQYFTGDVTYPFGYGLSYSTFAYSGLKISKNEVTPDDTITVEFDVTNTSDVDGQEVAEVYVVSPGADKVDRPAKRLKGFDKQSIAAGETAHFSIELDLSDLWYWDEENEKQIYDQGIYTIQVGPDSANTPLTETFTLSGSLTPELHVTTAIPSGHILDTANPEKTISTKLSASRNDQSFVNLNNSDITVTYTSEDPDVASVNGNGIVTAVSGGVTTIVASVTENGVTKSDSYPVLVRETVAADNIFVDGVALRDFESDVTTYSVTVDSLQKLPEVTASVNEKFTCDIIQATEENPIATVIVRSDNQEITYIIEFVLPLSSVDFTTATEEEIRQVWDIVRPNDEKWTVDENGLTVSLEEGDLWRANNDAKNLFLQNAGGDWTVETAIQFSQPPTESFQQAGIAVYQDDDNFFKIVYQGGGGSGSITTGGDKDAWDASGSDSTNAFTGNQVWLRMSKDRNTYTVFYSADGVEFTKAKEYTNEYMSPKIVLIANTGNQAAPEIQATFQYFKVLDEDQPEVPATGITLDQSELSLAPEATFQLTATVEPENATDKEVTWTSSDETVATVDENGLVTAVAEGSATVTAATANGLSATCTVTVQEPVVGKDLSVAVSGADMVKQDQRVPYTFSFSGEKENLGNVTVVFNVKGDPAGLFTGGAFEAGEGFSKYVLDEEDQADGSRRVKVVLAYGMDELTALEEAALTGELTDLFTYVIRSSAEQEGNIEVTVEQAIFTYAGDNDLYYADVTGATASTSVSAKDPYDIDEDGDFDQADITAAQGYYRAAEGDANWDEARKADVNADGVVDLTDLVELATAWLEVLG